MTVREKTAAQVAQQSAELIIAAKRLAQNKAVNLELELPRGAFVSRPSFHVYFNLGCSLMCNDVQDVEDLKSKLSEQIEEGIKRLGNLKSELDAM